jgi:hypothetical protein
MWKGGFRPEPCPCGQLSHDAKGLAPAFGWLLRRDLTLLLPFRFHLDQRSHPVMDAALEAVIASGKAANLSPALGGDVG